MNCVCGNKLKKILTEIDLFDGKIILKDVKAFYCNKCREQFFDSKEGDKIYDFNN